MEFSPLIVLWLATTLVFWLGLKKLARIFKRSRFSVLSSDLSKGPAFLVGYASVVDGDTVVIHGTNIRLFGIDAPEMNHPYGKKAKWALVALCRGQTVRARIVDRDAYGRSVAKCFLRDGRDLSAEMVKLGLAIDWPKFSGGEYKGYELPGVRKKLWLADARQKGRMHLWAEYEARRKTRGSIS